MVRYCRGVVCMLIVLDNFKLQLQAEVDTFLWYQLGASLHVIVDL